MVLWSSGNQNEKVSSVWPWLSCWPFEIVVSQAELAMQLNEHIGRLFMPRPSCAWSTVVLTGGKSSCNTAKRLGKQSLRAAATTQDSSYARDQVSSHSQPF